ncbi:MAG: undecaprenyldiphospho-muramoylpentapeptide beta-N-acetylglucosaminyltransferase [Cyanobacteria bacterium P01_G01_bin.19]
MTQKILLTGGGSAGHITVNMALIPMLLETGWEIIYMGSFDGIERELISNIPPVTYFAISTGKLRRYFDIQNFIDIFRIIKGIFQAYCTIRQEKPELVFSKGGFVSVPVVIGSRLNSVPVITHESDLTPGLANRINMYFAQKICTTFADTLNYLPQDKCQHIGAIVRPELKQGNPEKGRVICQFDSKKPVILVTGGSLGSQYINQTIRLLLDSLLENFQIIHICGQGNLDSGIERSGYKQFAYVSDELPDLMALCDLAISRAGSNFIFEFLALKKPMILVPLSKKASRGDQIENAKIFQNKGWAKVILEENLTKEILLHSIIDVYQNREKYKNQMNDYNSDLSLSILFDLLSQSTSVHS